MEVELYIFVVGDKYSASVVREYADGRPIEQVRPSRTLFEIKVTERIGDMEQWNAINEKIRSHAQKMGIQSLADLYPPEEMKQIVQAAASLRDSVVDNS